MSDILRLKRFTMVRLSIEGGEFFVPSADGGELKLETGYDVLVNRDEPDTFLMILRVGGAFPGTPEPMRFDIRGAGVFVVPAGMEAGKREYVVRYNGGMILYGILRGQLAMATGSFSSGAILLPTLDWREVIEGVESARAGKSAARLESPVATSVETTPVIAEKKPGKAGKQPSKKPKSK